MDMIKGQRTTWKNKKDNTRIINMEDDVRGRRALE